MKKRPVIYTILFLSFIIVFNIPCKNMAYAKSFYMATPENPYKISIIGDSISYEPSFATTLNSNPVIKVNTYAIGATQVAGKNNPTSFVNRTRGKFFNSDLIIIFGGTNDYCGMEAMCNKLGELTDTDTNTFCGAYNVMITNIKASNPGSTIMLLTPIKRIGYSNPNAYGYSLTNYVSAVQLIAAKHNVKCVDLFNNKDCDFINSHYLLNGTEVYINWQNASSYMEKNNKYLPDGLHPSMEGHNVIANTVLKYIMAE